jgi:hypothetical protein
MLRDMTGLQQGQMGEELKKEITGLGLAYNLLTQFTSFVAVEEMRITEGGQARTIRVPVEMPEGVSYSGVFGKDKSGMLSRVSGFQSGDGATASPVAGSGFGLGGGTGMALSNLGMDHNRKIAREEAGEMAQLRDLERKMSDGKLTPAEKREKLLPLKLEKSLLSLAAAGGDKTVEVRVILSDFSDEALAKLTAIGFKVLAKATSVKLVIGTIAADKLEALALLEVVRHVAPADS